MSFPPENEGAGGGEQAVGAGMPHPLGLRKEMRGWAPAEREHLGAATPGELGTRVTTPFCRGLSARGEALDSVETARA